MKRDNIAETLDIYDFLHKLVLNINSSPELPKALHATYIFLSKYFPIVGISLHRYLPELDSIHFDFLLTEDGFHELDTILPASPHEIEFLESHELLYDTRFGNSWDEKNLAYNFNRSLSAYIPQDDRTNLATILKSGEEVVGHLCLIGKAPNCFNLYHVNLIEAMRPSLGMTMNNLLQQQKIQKLKIQLDKAQDNTTENSVLTAKKTSIIGKESGLKNVVDLIHQVATSNAPVLIIGETGTGKELIADEVQRLSKQKNTPYLKVNCGAIPESLIESELFGHQKGSFTGAMTDRMGKFELAKGGTLFLDEIGELAIHSQVRLLRVLEDNVIYRVGGNTPIKVDVRIIAATNRSLEDMIYEGTFRKDLYHRLNVFVIDLPPLRKRLEDLPLLVKHFLKDISEKLNITDELEIDSDSLKYLREYYWPGNVRELKNLIERALTLSPKGKIHLAHYLPYLSESSLIANGNQSFIKKMIQDEVVTALYDTGLYKNINHESLPQKPEKELLALDDVIAEHIKKVLKSCNYKISGKNGAAEILQVNPSTLRKKMKKLNIHLEYTV